MAYLGQTAHETAFTNRVTNTMTGDGSDTTLTLSSAPISVNNVIVFIDGVMQRPTTDYTVSGTTLTFAVAPHNSANVQAIIGGGEHIGIPLAPITEDQLVDGVVTSAKLESGIQIPASKITSLAASKITGALPALDGSSLTGMSPDGVGIDNVTTNPSPTTNPSGGVGTIHLNKTTGEMFVCTNATANNNIWFNVGEGSGDISNAAPTNPTSTNSFPDINKNTSQNFTFSGATDADGSVTHYMVDQISNAALTVTAGEVAAGSAHTFTTGEVGSDTAVTFRVRSKDNEGVYSSGVTVSMNVLAIVYTTATGGSITTSGDYKIHTFSSSGTFAVSTAGSVAAVDYLVIAGGGGGGSAYAGGGGAGGYRTTVGTSGGGASAESALSISGSTNYTVTIGAGGVGAYYVHRNSASGSNSVLGSITSTGGGRAGTFHSQTGSSGGSGGGGNSASGTGSAGGSGTSNQGYAGGSGSGYNGVSGYGGGGGGGASAVGTSCAASGSSGNIGGAGGAGISSSITGASVGRAGGGGGSGYTAAGGAATHGGGAGVDYNVNPNSGTANTGGGGGGGGSGYGHGLGAGGSGIVIVRYKFQN